MILMIFWGANDHDAKLSLTKLTSMATIWQHWTVLNKRKLNVTKDVQTYRQEGEWKDKK